MKRRGSIIYKDRNENWNLSRADFISNCELTMRTLGTLRRWHPWQKGSQMVRNVSLYSSFFSPLSLAPRLPLERLKIAYRFPREEKKNSRTSLHLHIVPFFPSFSELFSLPALFLSVYDNSQAFKKTFVFLCPNLRCFFRFWFLPMYFCFCSFTRVSFREPIEVTQDENDSDHWLKESISLYESNEW